MYLVIGVCCSEVGVVKFLDFFLLHGVLLGQTGGVKVCSKKILGISVNARILDVLCIYSTVCAGG